ncbi:MAG: galactose-1-phosphate uridylyltransferase [Planctomycetes bacterium]|nr:galactose-1-phosphate uridylyltransferase [Planctomycetota bacterium]
MPPRPELRLDPFSGRRVVIAPARANRPEDFAPSQAAADEAFDPFAEGHEASTPAETLALRGPGSVANAPGWRVRIVPNRFPALECLPNSFSTTADGAGNDENLFVTETAAGIHEVIVECPHPETDLARLPLAAVTDVLRMYRDRLRMLAHDPRLMAAVIFKNSGSDAGASIAHAHSQLIATRFVPDDIARELAQAAAWLDRTGRCLYEDVLERELEDGRRLVLDESGYVVLCPFASRFPCEMMLLPRRHAPRFEATPDDELSTVGRVLKTALTKLNRVLDRPAYNYVLHTAPFGEVNPQAPPCYHWHIEIYPRTTRPGGYEWGAGVCINPVAPEDAAARLREASEVD